MIKLIYTIMSLTNPETMITETSAGSWDTIQSCKEFVSYSAQSPLVWDELNTSSFVTPDGYTFIVRCFSE